MQATTQKTNNLTAALKNELQHEAATTRRCLERIPAEKFGWKPHTKSMAFGQLAVHCAEMFGWVTMAAKTSELDFARTPYQPFEPQTNAELLEFFDRHIAEAVSALENATDESLAETWTMRNGEQVYFSKCKIHVLREDVFNHIYHHRGQLSVYLRLNNILVPALYGPSADEAGI